MGGVGGGERELEVRHVNRSNFIRSLDTVIHTHRQ